MAWGWIKNQPSSPVFLFSLFCRLSHFIISLNHDLGHTISAPPWIITTQPSPPTHPITMNNNTTANSSLSLYPASFFFLPSHPTRTIISSTNIFIRITPDQWRQLHHSHAWNNHRSSSLSLLQISSSSSHNQRRPPFFPQMPLESPTKLHDHGWDLCVRWASPPSTLLFFPHFM